MAGETRRTSVKVFSCPQCGAGVLLRAKGPAISVVCGSCRSVIDTTDENYRILSTAAKKLWIEPLIPLGTRGKLQGKTWEVIGFMERRDGTGAYSWREYLLFNPYYGFRWLVEADGHWNFVQMIKTKPSGRGRALFFRENSYRIFVEGEAVVNYVVGEFYWRVQVGEKVKVRDYICPPSILSCEGSKDETVWSWGEYIEPEEVRTAFSIAGAMPAKVGVAPNQPLWPKTEGVVNPVGKLWLASVCLLAMTQFLSTLYVKKTQVYEGTLIHVMGRGTEKSQATPSFTVPARGGTLELLFISPVNNSWVEFEGNLVNDQNGAAQEFGGAIEYYYGYEGGESWVEGSQRFTTSISEVPGGFYHLNLEISTPKPGEPGGIPAGTEASLPLNIIITRGVLPWSNFFLCLLVVSLYPFFRWLRERDFESKRWSNSDFSPG